MVDATQTTIVDLVNQRQIIALIKGEPPPFAKRSPELNEITRKFDVTYDAYADIQRNLERYWCLRYLEQEGIRELDATIIRDELVRASQLPLIVKLDKSPALPGKTAVRVTVGPLNYWDISGQFTLIPNTENASQEALRETSMEAATTTDTPPVASENSA